MCLYVPAKPGGKGCQQQRQHRHSRPGGCVRKGSEAVSYTHLDVYKRQMTKVIGVRFKANGKSYYFSPGDLELQQGDHVIVETARGTECGEVAKGPHDVPDSSIVKPLKTVTRMADAVDVRRMQQNRADEKRAFSVCEERIAKHKLDMKPVSYTHLDVYKRQSSSWTA